MTILTDVGSQDMGRVFAGRIRAVVAANAVVGDIHMVEGRRHPGVGCVAIVTVVATRKVRRVLAFRRHAIVTGEARADDLRMVNHVRRRERHIVMAVLAYICRINVRGVLAGRVRAVVAADAVVGDVHMVKVRRNPGVSRVAVITVVATRKVRRVLAFGRHAVVAGEARANDLRVIDQVGWRERHVVVAVLAYVRRIDMDGVLTGCVRAVVAADAVVGDVHMVKVRRRPGVSRVAVITVVATGKVRRVLAFCRHAIVAGEAGANHLRMVDHVGRRKRRNVMTIFADVCGVDVSRVLANGIGAVMAAETIAGDAGMVEIGWRPGDSCVAIVTGITAGDVRCMLTCRGSSVVTG